MDEKFVTEYLESDSMIPHPLINYPFALKNLACHDLKGGRLVINVFSYEGTTKDQTTNGCGFPWVLINDVLESEDLIACGKENLPSCKPFLETIIRGYGWRIKHLHTPSKVFLASFNECIQDLVPELFYCLDTGKMLDLSKLKGLSPNK
jgi:hypothetical protein